MPFSSTVILTNEGFWAYELKDANFAIILRNITTKVDIYQGNRTEQINFILLSQNWLKYSKIILRKIALLILLFMEV